MTQRIQIKRGLKEKLPNLFDGELGYCKDTNEVYIGTPSGNALITTNNNSSSNSHILDLVRWNIKNDGTDAVNTTIGVNNALVWASSQSITEIILPKGTYLIDETQSIQPQSNMTLNLGGSTLKVRSNGLPNYNIIKFDNGQKYSRITNGAIEGDRYTHDYSSGGTHEGGYGIKIGDYDDVSPNNNVEFISVDNLEIFNFTGDGIGMGSTFGLQSYDFTDTFILGGINLTDGTLTEETNRIRSSLQINLTTQPFAEAGYFGLYGDSYGGIGDDITTDLYDVVFYGNNGAFVSSVANVHFFDEVEIPTNANYAKIVLRQSTIPSTSHITVRIPKFAKQVYIEKCNIHHCRRLGISVGGAKDVHIRGNKIHHISGVAPACGIDVEDGYDLNQRIFISNNRFYSNASYDVILVSGKSITVDNNIFRNGLVNWNGVDSNIVNANYFIECGAQLGGETIVSNNHFYHSLVLIPNTTIKEIIINDCLFHNSSLELGNKKAYSFKMDGCKFFSDVNYSNPKSVIGYSVEPQTISNCIFEGCYCPSGIRFSYVPDNVKDGWVFNDVSFINIAHPYGLDGGFPSGNFSNCKFINTGTLKLIGDTVLSDCYFEWGNYQLFYITTGNLTQLKVINSSFSTNDSSMAFSFQSVGINNMIQFINNNFDYPASNNTTSIVEFTDTLFTSNLILFQGNTFKSNMAMISVKADTINSNIPLIFKDNLLLTVGLSLRNTHMKLNNYINGTIQ